MTRDPSTRTKIDTLQRRAVRTFLATGEQHYEGVTLGTLAYPQRTFVFARDAAGWLAWAFHANPAGKLYRADGALLFALEGTLRKESGGKQ